MYIDDLRDSTLHKTLAIYHEIFKGDETLFIIDDCSATKELKYRKHENDNKCMISDLAFSGRHANHSCRILSYKYNSVLKDFRENGCVYFIVKIETRSKTYEKMTSWKMKRPRNEICLKLKKKKIKHSKFILKTDQPTVMLLT